MKAINETWSIGKIKSCVVSDVKVKNTNFPSPPNPSESNDNDIGHYGGYMVCESVGNKEHGDLIAAAPEGLRSNINNLEFLEWIAKQDFNLWSDKRERLYELIASTKDCINKATII